ncbi:MAG: hypothetical protein HYV35_04665 [Lentisphaerae bacterium]|nr:hypothetical protein [Lentisphaerota bacterium]
MTALLEQVFKKASALPADIQDILAAEFLQEIEWESQWDATLKKTQDALGKLTMAAMAEHKNGKTEEMGFDEL